MKSVDIHIYHKIQKEIIHEIKFRQTAIIVNKDLYCHSSHTLILKMHDLSLDDLMEVFRRIVTYTHIYTYAKHIFSLNDTQNL